MILRIVKMHFREECKEDFKTLFENTKDRIAACEGCREVKLVQSTRSPEQFFTLSKWDGHEDLERYRNSELFKTVWAQTKAMFASRAEAWSTEEVG
jgi:heme-degrading monooxygenase HmoA